MSPYETDSSIAFTIREMERMNRLTDDIDRITRIAKAFDDVD